MNTLSQLYASVQGPGAISSGLATVAKANERLNRDAQQVANPERTDLTAALVDSKQAQRQAEAGAAILRAADRMLGSLLDERA